jgi:PAS domain S-box-containing protein
MPIPRCRTAVASPHDPQIAGILGYGPDELIDDPELWPSRIHPDDRAAAIAAYDAHGQTGEPLRAEYRMLARDGSEVWVRDEAFAMADDTRSGQRVSQGLLVDTTDRKRLESQLIHDALHDPLTGLANRVLLRDHLERALARQGAAGRVALFGASTTFRHAAGDILAASRASGRAVREETSLGASTATSSRSCWSTSSRGGVRGRPADWRAAPSDPARRPIDRRRWLDRHALATPRPSTEGTVAAKDLLRPMRRCTASPRQGRSPTSTRMPSVPDGARSRRLTSRRVSDGGLALSRQVCAAWLAFGRDPPGKRSAAAITGDCGGSSGRWLSSHTPRASRTPARRRCGALVTSSVCSSSALLGGSAPEVGSG